MPGTPTAAPHEVRGAAVLTLLVVLASALVGVLWGVVAPTEQLFVVEQGRGAVLTGESAHQFDAVAMFVCFGAVTGLLTAIAAWRRRALRGPLLQLGLLVGSLIGAVVMAQLGEQVAAWAHPRPHDPPIGQIVELPSEMGSWLALIVQPLVASLIVLFCAALSPSEDLGTGTGPVQPIAPFGSLGAPAYPAGDASYPAGGPAVPYGGYEPAGETGSGSPPQTRPSH
ncbi:DUF2567 domain-containing protein [Nocardia vulneris]|uniref:DUF2567 domain-containing protein n=1 Tax=Nocardia vulneris TaxID=1141657 RepID=A0ABR4ZIB0_9NOCA|nr:DUF2567 domain-containing protein [Nocardia vulneris]KIA64949.1 hypothetical protein FG87_10225 [Nocardia vulneris]